MEEIVRDVIGEADACVLVLSKVETDGFFIVASYTSEQLAYLRFSSLLEFTRRLIR